MPRDKDLPKKYDIPRERYRELKYFCLQYPRKKERAKDTYALSAAAPSGMPSASGCSDPTAKRAETDNPYAWAFRCSNCGEVRFCGVDLYECEDDAPKTGPIEECGLFYCPHCGAKMDGGKK